MERLPQLVPWMARRTGTRSCNGALPAREAATTSPQFGPGVTHGRATRGEPGDRDDTNDASGTATADSQRTHTAAIGGFPAVCLPPRVSRWSRSPARPAACRPRSTADRLPDRAAVGHGHSYPSHTSAHSGRDQATFRTLPTRVYAWATAQRSVATPIVPQNQRQWVCTLTRLVKTEHVPLRDRSTIGSSGEELVSKRNERWDEYRQPKIVDTTG